MTIRRRELLQIGVTSAASAVVGCSPPALVTRPRMPNAASSAFDGKVEHFIVLMMENRSYDLMLGGLPGVEYDGVPDGAKLPYEDRDGKPAWLPIVKGAPPDRFSPDPGHGFAAVRAQIHGSGGDRADMTGFARRYLEDHPSADAKHLQAYATIYADGRLPVLQTLAKEYGVATHWFSSLPSSTTPNRMFTHAGTSRGATGQGAYYTRVEDRMIFDKLDPRDWRVYFHDIPHLWLTGDAWAQSFCGQFHHLASFDHAVRTDGLPAYSFIEPQHIIPPWSSQHPSAGVSHGEKLIASVYNTLVSNPGVFEKSMLLIVYDEHGGFPDHVIPPGHRGWNSEHPDILHDVLPPDDVYGEPHGHDEAYMFTTLGPRVPAVIVSPWIERGTVIGWKAKDEARRATFDHTSILATVGRMTGVWVDSARARAATSLEIAINRESPRTDWLPHIEYRDEDYSRDGSADPLPSSTASASCDGVAGDLCEAFREMHGDATPEEVVAHFQKLVKP